MNGLMTKRCKRCQDGLIVLLNGKGRIEVFCSCDRGKERQDAKDAAELRDALLAAFRSTAPVPEKT